MFDAFSFFFILHHWPLPSQSQNTSEILWCGYALEFSIYLLIITKKILLNLLIFSFSFLLIQIYYISGMSAVTKCNAFKGTFILKYVTLSMLSKHCSVDNGRVNAYN